MKKLVVGAVMTTGLVLVTVYILNQIPFTRGLVSRALAGS